MELGLLTDSLSQLPRAKALDVAVELGIATVEIALGGWSSAPHADLDALLSDPAERRTLARDIADRGLRLEAFNASGNPLHPVHGDAHDAVVRGALQLAEEFGVDTLVLMSGLPAAPGDRFPAWITTVWPPENLTLLEQQWSEAEHYWGHLAEEAKRRGVRLAVEMHANQLVFNVSSLLRLRNAVGESLAATVGANLDPSHLFWMGADPVAVAAALQGAIHHVHAKDTRIEPLSEVVSRLEPVPNDQIERRGWNYVAVGSGHDTDWWSGFLAAVRTAGYDGPVSIENEDYSLPQQESVAQAAATLQTALDRDAYVSDVVRWGILGAASIARTVVPATATLADVEFTAVASRSPERAAEFAEETRIPRSFASYKELLTCEEVDAVYVALPIAQHVPWAIAALDAGKHVLCEKPLASTPADAARAFNAAERAGRHLVEGFIYRHHPQTLLARSLVSDGVLGRVTSVRAALSVDVPPGDIRRTAALGGGASLDLGCYCLHAIRTFGGEPEEVFAYRAPDPGDVDVDLRTTAALRLAGGALASFDVGLDLPRRDQLEVVGTLGRLEVPDPWICRGGYVVLEVDGVRTELPVDPDGTARLTGEEGDAYRLEFAAVSRRFSAGQPDPTGRAEAVAQAAAIAAVRRAATDGSPTRP